MVVNVAHFTKETLESLQEKCDVEMKYNDLLIAYNKDKQKLVEMELENKMLNN